LLSGQQSCLFHQVDSRLIALHKSVVDTVNGNNNNPRVTFKGKLTVYDAF